MAAYNNILSANLKKLNFCQSSYLPDSQQRLLSQWVWLAVASACTCTHQPLAIPLFEKLGYAKIIPISVIILSISCVWHLNDLPDEVQS